MKTARWTLLGLFTILLGAQPAVAQELAKGFVYDDANGNDQKDEGETGLPGVAVSNGRDIVETNAAGQYEIEVDDDDTIFVLKPKGWKTPLNENNLPQFYYVHKPNGSPKFRFPGVEPTGPLPKSINFALQKQEEPKEFKAILFGDPQPRNNKEVEYIAHDVVEGIIGNTDAAFGVTLGDIVFDDLRVFGPMNQAVGRIGIPWYNVIGNHDINFDADNDADSDETFTAVYGPNYYSFDYGPVHFVVIDDVIWHGAKDGNKGYYTSGLGPDQVEFLKNDLTRTPNDQLVVLLMHIPLVGKWNEPERDELYKLIQDRPFCFSVSAHTHYQTHAMLTEKDGWKGDKPHHHLINVTVSGSWWSGVRDERGIPHTMMRDGAPNGHTVVRFSDTSYAIDFVPASRPADYQMSIHTPEVVDTGELDKTPVFVNFFNGSDDSTVKIMIDGGEAITLEKTVEPDPYFVAQKEREEAGLLKLPGYRKLPGIHGSAHLWKTMLPPDLEPGTHLIEVEATDMFGSSHTGKRLFRVK